MLPLYLASLFNVLTIFGDEELLVLWQVGLSASRLTGCPALEEEDKLSTVHTNAKLGQG